MAVQRRDRGSAGWRTAVVLLWTALVVLVAGVPAGAAPAQPSYVKYYVVRSTYQGQPENLGEIALRFLGDASRAGEILEENHGRVQPDGGQLTDPNTLRTGWALVLSWDAVGADLSYGMVPVTAPAVPPTPRPYRTTAPPKPVKAAAGAPPATPASPVASCATVPASTGHQSNWAQLRMAADQAWPASRGSGVSVAVIDSGVDGSLPQLTGHVAVGADIVTGDGRGDTDCLGHGTAVAGIIAAQDVSGGVFVGLAPGAMVVPIRVVTRSPDPRPSDVATAIQVAVSTGAQVLTLALTVDLTEPGIAAAAADALRHNAIIVTGGSPPIVGGGAVSPGPAPAGILRVGGVGVDNHPVAAYQPGAVDVVAPGVGVLSLGISGVGPVEVTGTDYAVAFAAGLVALVRGAYPDLPVAQVIHRIEVTADPLTSGRPDAQSGWGMVNPGPAVNRVLPEEHPAAVVAPARAGSGVLSTGTGRGLAIAVLVLLCLLAVILVVVRVRRMVRSGVGEPPAEVPDGSPPSAMADPARS